MNIFKKIKKFKEYKDILKTFEYDLNEDFGLRIDRAYRLYRVINIPQEEIGDAYSLRTKDINIISEKYIRAYLSELRKYLDDNGLREMYKPYRVKKIAKYSYLIVIGFSQFRSNVYYNVINSLILLGGIIGGYFLFF